jgi:HlyD family secretion protein
VQSDQLSRDLSSLKIDRASQGGRSMFLGRLLWVVVIVGGLAALGWFVIYPKLRSSLLVPEVRVGEIAEVSPSQAETKLTATGYVIALTSAKVAAKVPGRIGELFVAEGDPIEKGAKVATLEDVDILSALAASRARAASAQSKVQIARAQQGELKVQLDRERPLVANGVEPKATLDDMEARSASLTASIRAAEAEAAAAVAETRSLETQHGSYTIYSPISGIVVTKLVQVGEGVSPGFGTPGVVEVVDMSSLVVEVDVPETRLAQIEEKNPCEVVLDSDSSKRHPCTVKEIGHRVNRSKATVPVRVRFDQIPPHVIPDMAARVDFLSQRPDAKTAAEPSKLVVPSAAIVQRNGGDAVFLFEDGTVHLTPIKVGAPVGDGRELQSSIPAGTKVVLSPPADLTDGHEVKEKR